MMEFIAMCTFTRGMRDVCNQAADEQARIGNLPGAFAMRLATAMCFGPIECAESAIVRATMDSATA